ncbi:MAG: ABC transporter permease subunit [Theionarchaea archaeon]|nr:ABC transporter permease subunit [Theionarchaea archaeon]
MIWKDTLPENGATHVVQCRLCRKEIEDTSFLSCRYCNTTYHRGCIVEHLHDNRFCPVCRKEISLFDLHSEEHISNEERSLPLKIRKPQWPLLEEVPLFETEILPRPVKQLEYSEEYILKSKKKRSSPIQGFISKYLPERTMKGFRKNRKGMLGLYMLSAAVFVAILAPLLILYDPVIYMAEDDYVYHPPTWKYPLGTDVLGRDVFSQVIWGFRNALVMAVPSALLVGVIGTVVGLVSGYYGGIVDAVLQRVSMTFLVWPSVPLVALIVFSWGPHMAVPAVILGVAFTLWPTTARAIRSEVMSLRGRAFIESAKVSGASSVRIVFRHILPRVIHVSFLYMTIAVASALILEATFNFLGLTSPAVITWGQMLSFTYHTSSARFAIGGGMVWWTIFPPATAITYMVSSFFLISSGLRESMRISSMSL